MLRERGLALSLNHSGNLDIGELSACECQLAFDVLADDGFPVVAGDVVPFDAVTIEVVEDGEASLLVTTRVLDGLAVVGLWPWWAKKAEADKGMMGCYDNWS